ncbi:MAG: PAC2 family protein [Nitrospirota bacterium]
MKGREPDTRSSAEHPFLIVGWNGDDGRVGSEVLAFLIDRLVCENYSAIEPEDFFPLDGVTLEDDCIQFPESVFFTRSQNDFILFKSTEPESDHYRFLSILLGTAESRGRIGEMYTVNGMSSQITHDAPRRIFAAFNSPELEDMLRAHNLEELSWEGMPAASTLLLWMAWKRSIPGLSLWLEVPFYLASVRDYQAIKTALSFFGERFNLGLDLEGLDRRIRRQNDELDRLRTENFEINRYLGLLESGLGLKEDIRVKLAREVYPHLRDI